MFNAVIPPSGSGPIRLRRLGTLDLPASAFAGSQISQAKVSMLTIACTGTQTYECPDALCCAEVIIMDRGLSSCWKWWQ